MIQQRFQKFDQNRKFIVESMSLQTISLLDICIGDSIPNWFEWKNCNLNYWSSDIQKYNRERKLIVETISSHKNFKTRYLNWGLHSQVIRMKILQLKLLIQWQIQKFNRELESIVETRDLSHLYNLWWKPWVLK